MLMASNDAKIRNYEDLLVVRRIVYQELCNLRRNMKGPEHAVSRQMVIERICDVLREMQEMQNRIEQLSREN